MRILGGSKIVQVQFFKSRERFYLNTKLGIVGQTSTEVGRVLLFCKMIGMLNGYCLNTEQSDLASWTLE